MKKKVFPQFRKLKKICYPSFSTSNNAVSNKPCHFCKLAHFPKQHPAYGKTCQKCKKYNYFAVVCRSFNTDMRNIKKIASEI